MTAIYLQGFVCPYDEDMDNTIDFQELPIDESLESPKYLNVIPNQPEDRLVGIAGNLNITYEYEIGNQSHIEEISRLTSLYEVIDHYDGLLTVIVDFNNYPANTWKQHSTQDSRWVSSVFKYKKITPDTSSVILYRFVVDNETTTFNYCKLSSDSITIATEYPKTVFIYGNIVEVTNAAGESRLLSDNNTKPYKLNGPLTFSCSADAYILVEEDRV